MQSYSKWWKEIGREISKAHKWTVSTNSSRNQPWRAQNRQRKRNDITGRHKLQALALENRQLILTNQDQGGQNLQKLEDATIFNDESIIIRASALDDFARFPQQQHHKFEKRAGTRTLSSKKLSFEQSMSTLLMCRMWLYGNLAIEEFYGINFETLEKNVKAFSQRHCQGFESQSIDWMSSKDKAMLKRKISSSPNVIVKVISLCESGNFNTSGINLEKTEIEGKWSAVIRPKWRDHRDFQEWWLSLYQGLFGVLFGFVLSVSPGLITLW